MKFCVIKGTTTVIDGSDNPQDIMLQNALNAEFGASEVEILTDAEYEARKALEPVLPPEPALEARNRADIDYLAIMTGVDLGV